MSPPPANPKIYHILHVDKLSSVIADGCLWCDAVMAKRADAGTIIGMEEIKERRLALPVRCHSGDHVGDYVPFYFCPRSIMLYVIHKANHPNLGYRGGQGPIIHLESDLHAVVRWARANERKWAFTLSNAGAFYSEFRSTLSGLVEIDWKAVASPDFRSAETKERKQAEFLLQHSFPWDLVERIGVSSGPMSQRVFEAMSGATHRPPVEIHTDWYY